MHATQWAAKRPDHAAIVMAETGEAISYGQLDAISNRGAQLFRSLGLETGDTIAIWAENRLDFLPICVAAERAGLYFTAISTRLTAAEAEYIIRDCGARLLILSPAMGAEATAVAAAMAELTLFSIGGAVAGATPWAEAVAAMPDTPIADQANGIPMLYSSGTTGRPKGVRHQRRDGPITADHPYEAWFRTQYGLTEDSVFLSPAPLYHAAPILFSLVMLRLGATVVLMSRFDPEGTLRAIERYGVSQTQMVPTMFVRLLRLPDAVRDAHDLSSLKAVVHAGAPCDVATKRAMIEWLGPIVHEYYSSTEGFGRTLIDSAQWLAHPGSVGRATMGIIRICDDEGHELGPGETGGVYFESDHPVAYHNDPEKTAAIRNPLNPLWRTFGDIGHVDEEGYLYLTDRKAFMIISGGVNIYPQEAENILLGHPRVGDVAVFGVPDAEMGEAVKAVVEPVDWADAGPALAAELTEWCRARLAHYKCPRSIDFDPALPRHANGKLYKGTLRDRYRAAAETAP